MTLSAYLPFFRNHNILSAVSQEPYAWDSVADSSRENIAIRYSLLPYWVSSLGSLPTEYIVVSDVSERGALSMQYTLFADASRYGTPPIQALFYEFPNEPELLAVDRQFMIGNALLVTPVLYPNVTTVKGSKFFDFLICLPSSSVRRQVISLVQGPSYGVTSPRTSDCRTPRKRRRSWFH